LQKLQLCKVQLRLLELAKAGLRQGHCVFPAALWLGQLVAQLLELLCGLAEAL
jgi:hypothetical protein